MSAENLGKRVLVGIPTRDRSAYLCGLLGTLLMQDTEKWDLLIVDTSDEEGLSRDDHIKRFWNTFEALGHRVFYEYIGPSGRSEASAVNRILLEARLRGYGFLFKVDDDHLLPPDCLSRLKCLVESADSESPRIASGVTPWMWDTFDGGGGASPHDVEASAPSLVTTLAEEEGEVVVEIRHFTRYSVLDLDRVRGSDLGSAANFMMRPDTRCLWSDIGPSSLYADAIWFLQLRYLLGYEVVFDLKVPVWHVTAPFGGVRPSHGVYAKVSADDALRKRQLLDTWRTLRADAGAKYLGVGK